MSVSFVIFIQYIVIVHWYSTCSMSQLLEALITSVSFCIPSTRHKANNRHQDTAADMLPIFLDASSAPHLFMFYSQRALLDYRRGRCAFSVLQTEAVKLTISFKKKLIYWRNITKQFWRGFRTYVPPEQMHRGPLKLNSSKHFSWFVNRSKSKGGKEKAPAFPV